MVSLNNQIERCSITLYQCVQWMCPKDCLLFVTSRLSRKSRELNTQSNICHKIVAQLHDSPVAAVSNSLTEVAGCTF